MEYPRDMATIAQRKFGATHSGIDAGPWSNWQDFPDVAAAKAFKQWADDSGFDAVWSPSHADSFRVKTRAPVPRSIDNPTPHVSGRYGAPMGRANRDSYTTKSGEVLQLTVTEDAAPFHLRRVRLDSGGYDPGGAYWGSGEPLYYFQGPLTDIDGFVRGWTREAAKAAVRNIHPHARFYK